MSVRLQYRSTACQYSNASRRQTTCIPAEQASCCGGWQDLHAVFSTPPTACIALLPPADVKVFRNFELRVSAGHTVALVGESGSGKSTVIGLIERYYDPTGGAVLVDGVDIRRLQVRTYMHVLGQLCKSYTAHAAPVRV